MENNEYEVIINNKSLKQSKTNSHDHSPTGENVAKNPDPAILISVRNVIVMEYPDAVIVPGLDHPERLKIREAEVDDPSYAVTKSQQLSVEKLGSKTTLAGPYPHGEVSVQAQFMLLT